MKTIFLISDSPYATTGLGRLTRGFLSMFPEYRWVIWGSAHPYHIEHWGDLQPYYNNEDYNGNFEIISPRSLNSQYDPNFAFDKIAEHIGKHKVDYLITCIDYNKISLHFSKIKELKMALGFEWINYFPVDREWVVDAEIKDLRYPDHNVTFTKFGVDKYKKINDKVDIKQIYHPIDIDDFEKISKTKRNAFRKQWYGELVNKDDYLVGTVNRNFARKDPVSTLHSFIEFNKKHPKSKMYFHGNRITNEGHDLSRISSYFGSKEKSVIFAPEGHNEVSGFSQEILNQIYQSFDLFITSSMGEGFGYSTIEAMLSGIPVIAPDNTSFTEFLSDDRGYLVPLKDWVYLYGTYDIPWYFVDRKKMVETMNEVYNNKEESKKRAKKAREWVIDNLRLEIIKKQWEKILT